jgi:sulfite reductase (NADPH) flavoprotein alpha-component
MSANPILPIAPAPLPVDRLARLQAAVGDLDPHALNWASGYLAALAAERLRAGTGAAVATTGVRATVLYASQTGNGRRLAEKLGRSLEAAGLAATVVSAADYPTRQLAQERLLYVIASTHGDGDPPDDARALFDLLQSRRAPRLESLTFSVLALGDSSYPQFCATGRALDERFEALGARRLGSRADCDVDFEPKAGPWIEQAIELARQELGSNPAVSSNVATLYPLATAGPALASRDAPLEVELVASQRLTARGADRDVRHLEFALPSRQFEYEPGDAIGLITSNPLSVVHEILAATQLEGSTPVTVGATTATLAQWLRDRREIARVGRPLIERLAERTGSSTLANALQPGQATHLRALLKQLQVADLLALHPAEWDAETLVRALNPLAPRLYSVASSRAAVGDEAHLTIAVVDYSHRGQRRVGPASWQLATSASGSRFAAFVEPNPRFRLPVDGARDIIMIGPGTGVAPFRGFVQQRAANGGVGRNWLVYGGRRRERDFLYQLEWQAAQKRGELTRLDVAFSRDTEHKVYVQDRLREHGRDLFEWLENGAHLYVCGDAERMAPDVHAALIDVVATHGGRSTDAAAEYVSELARTKRYARDVY